MVDISNLNFLNPYQEAIQDLRAELAKHASLDRSSILHTVELLICSVCLAFFGFDQADGTWFTHVGGSLSVMEFVGNQQMESYPYGRSLRLSLAHLDISAFTIGKQAQTCGAWLDWNLCPVDKDGRPVDISRHSKDHFSTLEVATGYPESLLTVIAWLSRYVDEQTGRSISTERTPLSSSDIERMIRGWNPPEFPAHLDTAVSLALGTAWETVRKAAFLFLWRGKGFFSDVKLALPHQYAQKRSRYIREILYNLSTFVDLAKTRDITIANGMLWPLVVASNEISFDNQLQSISLGVIDGIEEQFGLGQMKHIRQMLRTHWHNAANAESGRSVSLEGTARSIPACIPIY